MLRMGERNLATENTEGTEEIKAICKPYGNRISFLAMQAFSSLWSL